MVSLKFSLMNISDSTAFYIVCLAGPVMIQFENPVLSVQEGDGVVEVCAQIIIPVGATLGRDIAVPFVGSSGQHASMCFCFYTL